MCVCVCVVSALGEKGQTSSYVVFFISLESCFIRIVWARATYLPAHHKATHKATLPERCVCFGSGLLDLRLGALRVLWIWLVSVTPYCREVQITLGKAGGIAHAECDVMLRARVTWLDKTEATFFSVGGGSSEARVCM
jgi:hypothetical protein